MPKTPAAASKKELPPKKKVELFGTLKSRFGKNMARHPGLSWEKVEAKLEADADKLWTLQKMEETGGEPDVVGQEKKTGEIVFFDCSAESPRGRRSLCYDREALEARKENKPKDSVLDAAAAMGIELLTEEQYRSLQIIGFSIRRRPAGSRRLPKSGTLAAPSFATAATARSSRTPTGRNPTMRPEGFEALFGSDSFELRQFKKVSRWKRLGLVSSKTGRFVVLLLGLCYIAFPNRFRIPVKTLQDASFPFSASPGHTSHSAIRPTRIFRRIWSGFPGRGFCRFS